MLGDGSVVLVSSARPTRTDNLLVHGMSTGAHHPAMTTRRRVQESHHLPKSLEQLGKPAFSTRNVASLQYQKGSARGVRVERNARGSEQGKRPMPFFCAVACMS